MFVGTVSVFKGAEVVGYAVVDADDFIRVLDAGPWTLHSAGYASRKIKGKTVLMHRFILDITDSTVHVDHLDHNPLNNRRENLRPGTQAENNANSSPNPRSDSSSKYKGVGRYRGGWRAQGWTNGKTVWLGRYKTEEQARDAYEEWRTNV